MAPQNTLYSQHFTTIDGLSRDTVDSIFDLAARIEYGTYRGNRRNLDSEMLRDRTLTCLFYEPSTRTSSSFIAAMQRLGGNVIPITQGVQFSSVAKGETLEDTILTLAQYSDAIVLRHPELGAADRAAAVSPVPVINAGDGPGEHPTQALLDLYTIWSEIGCLDNFHVAFIGDIRYGRTVHSLLKLLLTYTGIRVSLICPETLGLDDGPLLDRLHAHARQEGGRAFEVYTVGSDGIEACPGIEDVLGTADVFYVTRVQKERFSSSALYDEVRDSCILTPSLVGRMKPTARILHPLPRVNEIPRSIDTDPRAAYFRQVRNGMYVRAALLAKIIGGQE